MSDNTQHPKLSYDHATIDADGIHLDGLHLDGYRLAQAIKVERAPRGFPVALTVTLYADDVTVTEAAQNQHGSGHIEFTDAP